ncbi:MAG: zinc ribbon domain-containing protein [Candidatus Omnitrophota bacterium]
MKKCPYCAEMIQDEAVKCRYCGESLEGRMITVQGVGYWGYEYKSKSRWFGLPLVHIARGIDPKTGHPRKAKGIIAIGNIAVGVLAIGGIAMGGITLGGLSLGLLAFGGLGLGVVSFAGLSIALFLAVGGLALSPFYAIGGLAFAQHSIGGNGVDQWFLRQVEKWWMYLGPRDPTIVVPPQ